MTASCPSWTWNPLRDWRMPPVALELAAVRVFRADRRKHRRACLIVVAEHRHADTTVQPCEASRNRY